MRDMAFPMVSNKPPAQDFSSVSTAKTQNFIDRILRVRPMKRQEQDDGESNQEMQRQSMRDVNLEESSNIS